MTHSPLLTSAMAALERAAETEPEAAQLLAMLESLDECGWYWSALFVLNSFYPPRPLGTFYQRTFDAKMGVMAALLKEMSADCPVPMSLMH
jgi:hypothetical protein